MWTAEHLAAMDQFLKDFTQTMLVFYIDEFSGLKVEPEQKQLAYFIRQENAEITEENFHEVVQFGSIRRPYIDSLMRVLNAAYLPCLFRKGSWPESIKNEFFSEIYHFMTSLTDTRYKIKGRTVLYIPIESFTLSAEVALKDKAVVQRLENEQQDHPHVLQRHFLGPPFRRLHQLNPPDVAQLHLLHVVLEGLLPAGILHAQQVCDSQQHFARWEDGKQTPLPCFFGQQGPQMTRSLLEIEETFNKYLNNLRNVKGGILDVKNTTWHEDFSRFRAGVKDLEVMTQNLITSAFETVKDVEHGVEIQDIFQHLSSREAIKRTFDKKTVDVFMLFNRELSLVNKELSKKTPFLTPYMCHYSGMAHWMRALRRRVDRPMKTYQLLVQAMDEIERKTFHEWTQGLDKDSLKRLDTPLLIPSAEMPGMLDINFDKHLLKLFVEIHYWERVLFEIPHYVVEVYERKEDLRNLRENLLLVAQDYNRIISMLSAEERGLFRERIRYLDRKIQPGLKKLHWSLKGASTVFISELGFTSALVVPFGNHQPPLEAEAPAPLTMFSRTEEMLLRALQVSWASDVFSSCHYECGPPGPTRNHLFPTSVGLLPSSLLMSFLFPQVQNIVNEYKAATLAIARHAQQMSEALLVRITGKRIYNDLEFEEDQKDHRDQVQKKLVTFHEGSIAIMRQTYEVFKNDGSEVQQHWFNYTVRMNRMMEDALRLNVKWSLMELSRAINGDGKTSPNPLFRVKVILQDNSLGQAPQRDEDIKKIQTQISSGMQNNAGLLQAYLKTWDRYREIWEVNKDAFINRYRHLNPLVSSFDADTARYEFSRTLEELSRSLQLHETLQNDLPKIEGQIPPIHEQFAILEKYEVVVDEAVLQLLGDLNSEWLAFQQCLLDSETMLKKHKEKFKTGLIHCADDFKKKAQNLLQDFDMNATMKEEENALRSNLGIFKIDQPASKDLQKLERELDYIQQVWEITKEWEVHWEEWKNGSFKTLKTEDRNWEIIETSKTKIEQFKRTMPLITDLRNPALRERHWDQVKDLVLRTFDQEAEDFRLENIIELGLDKHVEKVAEISSSATKELAIEQALENIAKTWAVTALDIVPYKDKGHHRIRGTEDVFQALDDNQVALSTMKASRFVKPFEKDVDRWERCLSLILEVIEMLLTVQRQWMYLENIFLGEDIRKQLPGESASFDNINSSWKIIMDRFVKDNNALRATHYPGLLDKLVEMNSALEDIQKSLDMYLETKRHIFPRFYFLSNDDLLEILGQSRNPDAEWLCDVERAMRWTLREVLRNCRLALKKMLTKRDKWVKEWPGQMVITASQIQWTTDVSKCLATCKERGDKKYLKVMKKKQVSMLNKYSEAIRGTLTKIMRLKIVALVTVEVHARDVIEKLYKSGLLDVTSFEWLSQLRLYWEKVLSVVAQQILSILSALAANMTRFTFEGHEINLVWSCGIFITMNPVYTLYSLAVQQLSKQDHYDFGLRALTSLLRYAGKKRRVRPDLSDEEDMNIAKLTSGDVPLFNAITQDLFPGIECPVIDYGKS
ncbi:hypothetical protein E2320_022465 [Naja naja]|nr:hypothetical protein E2320_022465 [Naja naja]